MTKKKSPKAKAPDYGPYMMPCMPFPKTRHESWPQHKESVKWNAKKHLQWENPEYRMNLDFKKVKPSKNAKDDLAYSAPFRVLSKEGIRCLRKTIADHESFVKRNERQKGGILRGLGYMSKFNEEFLHDPAFLDRVEEIAGCRLYPATFGSHITQVNFGRVGEKSNVESWHFDSVDFVLVIILSDIKDMVGGELQVLQKNLGGKEATLKMCQNGVPEKYVENQSYQNAGYGILAQGSKIFHKVSPVMSANEDRISYVISFARADAFGEDHTRTLKYCKDHENVIVWEMARHEAWRQQGVLNWVIEESDPNQVEPEDFANILDGSAARLQRAAAIIRNEYDDAVGWVPGKKEKKSK